MSKANRFDIQVTERSSVAWEAVEVAKSFHDVNPNAAYRLNLDAVFERGDGLMIRRPMFWSGGSRWTARACWPGREDRWSFRVEGDICSPGGMISYEQRRSMQRHELPLRMSNDKCSVERADGLPFFMVADTAWALPFRATPQQARVYAEDRSAKGFNASLLMSIQPDMRAAGPEGRGIRDGFDVGFEDLADGTLNRLRPAYFDELDRLIDMLRSQGIVPVIQPVFQGFGWKGLDAAGGRVPPDQYARYCRYLVARYGSGPAIWLVGADGSGEEPTVESGGETIHACDAYAQPTGIHYAPDARFDSHQSSEWLDFQWCQTGHRGQHHPERVMWMSCQTPSKAVANGEPTYERPGLAAEWWQGHEAWQNLCAGGTMGVVYGAMSLWQWKQCRDEAGHPPWCVSEDHDWEDALDFPGSTHVGRVGRILSRYDLRGCTPDWSQTLGVAALHRPGELLVVYLESGGNFVLRSRSFPDYYAIYDLTRGDQIVNGCLKPGQSIVEVPEGPHVAVFADHDHYRKE